MERARLNMNYAYQQVADAQARVDQWSAAVENAKLKASTARTIEEYRLAVQEQKQAEASLKKAQDQLQAAMDVYYSARAKYLQAAAKYRELNGVDYPDSGPLPLYPVGRSRRARDPYAVPGLWGAELVGVENSTAGRPRPSLSQRLDLPQVPQFEPAPPTRAGNTREVSYGQPPGRQNPRVEGGAQQLPRTRPQPPKHRKAEPEEPPREEPLGDQGKVRPLGDGKPQGVPLLPGPALAPDKPKARPLPAPAEAPRPITDAQLLIGVAENKLAEGDAKGALKDAEAAVRQDNRDAAAWLIKAKALDALGRRVEAEKCAQASVHLAPRSAQSHEVLAWVRFSLGRTDEAVASLAAAARFDPDSELARAYGDYVRSKGRLEPAEVEIDTETVAAAMQSGGLPAPQGMAPLPPAAQKPASVGRVSRRPVYAAFSGLWLWAAALLCAAGALGFGAFLWRIRRKKTSRSPRA
ncbi:MAG: hypothetical protein HY922_14145 [Elusimicrobia bacterium]|nr:hypothetical protein [Elusimicrobiota bacterium]